MENIEISALKDEEKYIFTNIIRIVEVNVGARKKKKGEWGRDCDYIYI